MAGEVRIATALNNDYSANAITVTAILALPAVLLCTIPQNLNRKGFLVQNQSAAQIYMVMDDSGGAITPSVVILGGGSAASTQGGDSGFSGNPHHGRIRVYGTTGSQVMAADW